MALQKKFSKWKQEFPFCHSMPKFGTWLWLRDDQHLGCKACHLSSVKSCYGTGLLSTARQLSLDRLRKHAQSEVHLEP